MTCFPLDFYPYFTGVREMGLTLCMIRKRDGEDMICIFSQSLPVSDYFSFSMMATVSTCMVWGNMSTGWTFLRV